MKNKIITLISIIFLFINIIVIVTPLFGNEKAKTGRERFCDSQGCGNDSALLCATHSFDNGGGTTTWYCYYGEVGL